VEQARPMTHRCERRIQRWKATREEQQVLQPGDSSFFAVFSFSFKLVNLFVVCCKKQTEKSGKHQNIDTLSLSLVVSKDASDSLVQDFFSAAGT
jgi:hypothetical protein